VKFGFAVSGLSKSVTQIPPDILADSLDPVPGVQLPPLDECETPPYDSIHSLSQRIFQPFKHNDLSCRINQILSAQKI